MEKMLQVRMDEKLRSAFIKTCKDNDSKAAQEIRKFIRSYVSKNGQTKLI